MHSTSNFWPSVKKLPCPLYELPNLELRSSNTCQVQVFCIQLLLKLPSLEFKGFKRGWGKLSCLGQTFVQPKKLQNYKTQKKLKTNKHKGKCLEEKKWKHEIGKDWKLISSCCIVCGPRLLQEQEHKEYICKNLKQDIRVSNTPFPKN